MKNSKIDVKVVKKSKKGQKITKCTQKSEQ